MSHFSEKLLPDPQVYRQARAETKARLDRNQAEQAAELVRAQIEAGRLRLAQLDARNRQLHEREDNIADLLSDLGLKTTAELPSITGLFEKAEVLIDGSPKRFEYPPGRFGRYFPRYSGDIVVAEEGELRQIVQISTRAQRIRKQVFTPESVRCKTLLVDTSASTAELIPSSFYDQLRVIGCDGQKVSQPIVDGYDVELPTVVTIGDKATDLPPTLEIAAMSWLFRLAESAQGNSH